ncbi:MAG: ABC transporter ATP-binding protein [Alteromonadaceae bacterium]|nr:MAG: ABC transporter ATP-binding protein [Alteromonadaceae bacterium]
MGLMILAIAIGTVSAFAGISLIALINTMIEQHRADFGAYGWPFIGLLMGLIISGVVSQVMLSRIGHRIIYRLRLAMVNRVLGTDIESLEKAGDHRLYAVLTKDINDIGNAFSRLPIAIYNGLLLLGGIAYLGYLSLMFLGITLGVVVLGIIVDHFVSTKMYALYKQVRNTEDRLYKQYEAAIEGRNELRLDAARRGHLFHSLLEPAAKICQETKARADIYWAINLNWTVVLIFSLMGLIVFLGINQLNLGLEVVTGYVLALMFLRTPITSLIDMIPNVIAGSVSLKKINQLKLAQYDASWVSEAGDNDLLEFKSLQLRHLAYAYPVQDETDKKDDYTFALKPINLTISAGEILFVIGGNGSGKSTFSKVLTGLYPSTSGQVFINQQLLEAGNQAWYRSHFVTVLSDFYLFDHMLTEQNPLANDQRANHYLERLQIAQKVQVKNGMLSTTDLSQGQRKRLALLAVYLSPRPIVLLDEWAADQDPVFRRVFYHEILPELKAQGKTVIAITHDDKYFDCADRILRFDAGEMRPVESNALSASRPQPDIALTL